jgi:hypothetical protein
LDRQEQQQRVEQATVVQEEEKYQMNTSPPSYHEIEAIVEPANLANVSGTQTKVAFHEENFEVAKEEALALNKYIPSAPPAEDESALHQTTAKTPYRPQVEVESSPPPSYEDLEQGAALVEQNLFFQEEAPETGAAFDYDTFGNLITTEEKLRIEEEQSYILEMIQRENAEKNVQQATMYSSNCLPSSDVKSYDRLPSLHSSADKKLDTTKSITPTATSDPQTNALVGPVVKSHNSFRMVTVGPGKQIQVHDQTKTREAIQRGTAVLVECVSCSQWLQVADSAKLMFCPCCEAVVPVVPQYRVKTREEAIRLTRDRQVAERLQNEFILESESSASPTATGDQSDNELTFSSWREYFSAIFSTAPKHSGNQQFGIACNQCSSSRIFSYPAEGRCKQESTADNGKSSSQQRPQQIYTAQIIGNEETGRSNDEEETTSLLPARVANHQQNLFSCVEKSFSSVFSSMGRFGYGEEEKNEEVDEELLALTNRDILLREETTNCAEYHRLLDYEDKN